MIVANEGKIELAIECKASRMSFEARFSEVADNARGYGDIVKGLVQLWRFFSHCRRGLTGLEVTSATVGMLLTLDSWLVMGGLVSKDILRRATEVANTKYPDILDEDRKAVLFCPISDLESSLADANEASFRHALARPVEPQFDGWMLSSVHEQIGAGQPRKAYPFKDLAELLPWWSALEEQKRLRSPP